MQVGANLDMGIVARQGCKQVCNLFCVRLPYCVGQRNHRRTHGHEYTGKLKDNLSIVWVAIRVAKTHADVHDQALATRSSDLRNLVELVEGFGDRLVGISLLKSFRNRHWIAYP